MKIAVITGASSGLGIEFLRAAVTLCPEIDTYWLIARREDRLEALKPQFPEKNLRPIALDLTDSAALKQFNALLEREKPEISLLINNAGFGKLCDFATSDVEADRDDRFELPRTDRRHAVQPAVYENGRAYPEHLVHRVVCAHTAHGSVLLHKGVRAKLLPRAARGIKAQKDQRPCRVPRPDDYGVLAGCRPPHA